MERSADERRKLWIKKSALLRGICNNLEHPIMKWAENPEELDGAFSLVHEEYLRAGYIHGPGRQHRTLANVHLLLPYSRTLIVKCGRDVIATVSMVLDNAEMGLPMDSLYHDELNALRKNGEKLCEFCSLAISHKHTSSKVLMPMIREVYWQAKKNKIDSTCIMVNPKHVPFYATALLYREMGPERFYPRVNAPAVALRGQLRTHEKELREAYAGVAPEHSMYSFFYEAHSFPHKLPESLQGGRMRRDGVGWRPSAFPFGEATA